ncbi:MAG TPA: tRNA pseudouridine(38-40) synthase TruA [Acidimicrobiia bacterium]|nr:tRNA pseudouridine(38-40) synthase TruA [Acidimicrobiia bacterium]
MPVVRMELAYDGTDFHGFARQPGLRTVQGALEEALHHVFHVPVTTTAAGRTDAGVHARGQVVSFLIPGGFDQERLLRSLNGMLAPRIAVKEVSEAPDEFDARFSAHWRAYRYHILNSSSGDPLRRAFSWHVPEPLDMEAMNSAAAHLTGEHDFAAFCRKKAGNSTVRRVLESRWHRSDDLVVFGVRASSFCHQMVRSLVGLMVDVGRGRRAPEETVSVLAAGDRQRAGQLAPPHGLILWEVGYEP